MVFTPLIRSMALRIIFELEPSSSVTTICVILFSFYGYPYEYNANNRGFVARMDSSRRPEGCRSMDYAVWKGGGSMGVSVGEVVAPVDKPAARLVEAMRSWVVFLCRSAGSQEISESQSSAPNNQYACVRGYGRYGRRRCRGRG